MSNGHSELRRAMADRDMRLAHLLWHGIREMWNQLNEEDREGFRQSFGDAWVPPRPALDASGQVIEGTGAGEDFLYMHRVMLEHANHLLAGIGAPPVKGWSSLPTESDPTCPVPRSFNLPESVYTAKNDTEWKDTWLVEGAKFRDAGYLGSVTLDRLGTDLEYGLHAAMHVRWGGFTAIGLRISTGSMTQPVPVKWDPETYNSLLDPYSAHVHALFWNIHGWIDDCIVEWEKVNGSAKWNDPWQGPMAGMHECDCGCETSAVPPTEATTTEAAGGGHHHGGHGDGHAHGHHAHHHAHDPHAHHHGAASTAPSTPAQHEVHRPAAAVEARILRARAVLDRQARLVQMSRALGFLGVRGFCGFYGVRERPERRQGGEPEGDPTVRSPKARPAVKLRSGHDH